MGGRGLLRVAQQDEFVGRMNEDKMPMKTGPGSVVPFLSRKNLRRDIQVLENMYLFNYY